MKRAVVVLVVAVAGLVFSAPALAHPLKVNGETKVLFRAGNTPAPHTKGLQRSCERTQANPSVVDATLPSGSCVPG